LAARFLERDVRPLLERVPWLDVRIVPVENTLYGKGITVAGLLPGADFQRAIAGLPADCGSVWIPDVAVNHDGLFLDDLALDELLETSPVPVHVSDGDLVALLEAIADGGAA
jgi:hypothetical protein